jgi:hypothetical protein
MTDSERPTSPRKRDDSKRYTAPVLTEYGSVAKLTMAKVGSFRELTNKKDTSCL